MTAAEAQQLRTEFKEDLEAMEGRILDAINADKVSTEKRIDREVATAKSERVRLEGAYGACQEHCADVRKPLYERIGELEKQSAIVKLLIPAVIGGGATVITLLLKEVVSRLLGGG